MAGNPNYELDDGDLVVKRVRNESAGEYECTASNKEGSSSAVGTLKVVSSTTVETGPGDIVARVGDRVTLPCVVIYDNNYELTVVWKKDASDVDIGGRFELVNDDSDHSLIIDDLEFGDAGKHKS